MAYTTFNGWNIVPMPASPGERTIQFSMTDTVGETSSPWTKQSQVQQWPGADWWELELQLPPLTLAQARQWRAWLAALRGKANVFQIGDPLATLGGTPQGTPVCISTTNYNLASSTVLYTQGWTPNASNLLVPGDYLQIGYRLHMVAGVTPVSSNASGQAAFEIWPSLRESATGVALQLGPGTTGLFRLADNKRQFSESYTRLFGLTFKAVEAR